MFNKVMLARRKISIHNMSNSKGSRDHLEECQPSNEFLFGPKLKKLTKALKEEAQFSGQSGYRRNFSYKFSQRGNRVWFSLESIDNQSKKTETSIYEIFRKKIEREKN